LIVRVLTSSQPASQPRGGAAALAGAAQLLTQGVQPIGAVHSAKSDSNGDRALSSNHLQAGRHD